jgi:hypothetical protein
LEQFGATADMLMGSVLDNNSTTAAATNATNDCDQQQQRATAALAEAHSVRNGTAAASSSVAPSHGGPAAASSDATGTATAVEENIDRWSFKNVNRVQFKPAGTLQLLWQTHSDLDIFAAKDLQEFALASDALQLADSNSRCVQQLYNAASTSIL